MEIKNILVTGSAGYIGSVLCQKLIDQGFFVTGIDTLFYNNSIIFKQDSFAFRLMDIRDLKLEDFYGIDAVIHLAALSNDHLGALKREWTEEINYKESVRLSKICKKAGVKRFIYSSSCSVYGKAKTPIVNETSKTNPRTIYAKTKIKSEIAIKKLADKNFCVILMRNSTVYGFSPAFRDDLVVNNLVACALSTNKIVVKSDGTPWRPLIDVRDLSEIFIKFLKIDSGLINGRIINVGFNENNYQVRDLLYFIQKQLPDCKIIYTHEHGTDSRSYQVSFNKLHKVMPNLNQEWTMEKSISDLITNLKKYKYNKGDFLTGKYTRQETMKKLLKKNKLTDKLFWETTKPIPK